MSANGSVTLSGRHKAAVLVLAIGPEAATQALRCMSPEAITDLARAVTELEAKPVGAEVVDAVLAEFSSALEERSASLEVGAEQLQGLLESAVGRNESARIIGELDRERRSANPFADFANFNADEIDQLLQGELPQVKALVLSHVGPEVAAQCVSRLPDEVRTDVLIRMARIEEVPPELALEVSAALGMPRNTRRQKASSGQSDEGDRLRTVASVINVLEEQGERGAEIERIRIKDEGLAEAIEGKKLVIDDVVLLDNPAIQRVLSQVQSRTLALALKAADPEVEAKLLGNLSKRARETVAEEKELLGPQPLSEVQNAQQEVVDAMQELINSGEIELRRGKEAELVH